MQFHKNMLMLYAVTDRSWTGRQTLYEQVEAALRGGVTMVQLREKDLTEDEFEAEARDLLKLCHRWQVPLIINDNVNLALRVRADGAHVGLEDTPVSEIRSHAPKGFIIGATAKTVAQAQTAQQAGADYLGVGAVFPSPTKANALRITPALLRKICSSVTIPVAAIGGIGLENLDQLQGCGMAGIAVVSAVFAAEDIQSAAARLRTRLEDILV
jgi:thiamine-phosphate pyrophosphorylase